MRSDVPQPIFILGFPRSGTTLVEQTLSAHPKIAAGDELPLIHEITAIMPRMLASPLGYPEALAELWMGDQREGLDNLRDYYLQKVRQMGVLRDGATRFTDKMPLNETHLGLIALLFPEAPLIHVLRHPLDIMVSAFSNQFTHGFFCAYDLETAARHYVRVMDLVQHYRAEMTLRYLPIRYEDIVADQEASVRAMLAFVGEDFDQRLPDVPREPPLCAHRQLRAGDRAAVRPLGASLPPLPRASGAGAADPAAGDRASRLHGGLMETPAPRRRPRQAPCRCRSARCCASPTNTSAAGGWTMRSGCSTTSCASRRTRAMRCISRASSHFARATSRSRSI